MEHIYGVPSLSDSDRVSTIAQWSRALARAIAARDAAVARDTGAIPTGDPETVAGMVARLGGAESAIEALTPGPWKELTLESPWKPYTAGGGYFPGLRARVTPLGLQIQGMILGGSATSNIADLPDDMQPPYAVMFNAPAAGNVTAFCSVSMNFGRMRVRYNAGPASAAFVNVQTLIPML